MMGVSLITTFAADLDGLFALLLVREAACKTEYPRLK
jgi:hypothetical protein